MALQAPLDIWTQILEEIIDVPEFFSADPLVTFGVPSWPKFRHEEYYWRSERWRNNLRRVHSSWNGILSQTTYRHRFVLMSDVTHGRVFAEDIPWYNTRRIAFGPAVRCTCVEFCSGWRPLRLQEPAGNQIAINILEQAIAHHKDTKWKLKIVDGVYIHSTEQFRAIFKGQSIEAILTLIDEKNFSDHQGHLRQLHLTVLESQRTRGLRPPSFPQLTTLVVDCRTRDLELHSWHLPTLQHLQLSGLLATGYQMVSIEALERMLQGFGSNLRTLHIDYVNFYTGPSARFWSLVPRLTQIRLDCPWTYAPPENHPLAVMSIPSVTISALPYAWTTRNIPGWNIFPDIGKIASPEEVKIGTTWKGRRLRIKIERTWEMIMHRPQEFEVCLKISNRYASVDWSFTDYTGTTINDFIVLLLQRRRSGRHLDNFRPYSMGYRVAMERRQLVLPPSERMGDTDRDLLVASLFAFECF